MGFHIMFDSSKSRKWKLILCAVIAQVVLLKWGFFCAIIWTSQRGHFNDDTSIMGVHFLKYTFIVKIHSAFPFIFSLGTILDLSHLLQNVDMKFSRYSTVWNRKKFFKTCQSLWNTIWSTKQHVHLRFLFYCLCLVVIINYILWWFGILMVP